MTSTFANEVRTQSIGGTIVSWDDLNLEPDRDPVDGRMVPCVVCMSSPQVGGKGVCSPECEADLEEWVKKDEDDWNL